MGGIYAGMQAKKRAEKEAAEQEIKLGSQSAKNSSILVQNKS
jgi:hypothetical protein